jgi:hypothetical protein
MATNTAGDAGREFHTQQIHYLRKTITYLDNGTNVVVGTLPAGSLILPAVSGVYVTTAFNGNSSNVVDIGITGTLEKYASDLALGTLGHIELDVVTDSSGNSSLTTAVETILAGVISTASASAGSAEVVIAYIPDNDG